MLPHRSRHFLTILIYRATSRLNVFIIRYIKRGLKNIIPSQDNINKFFIFVNIAQKRLVHNVAEHTKKR